MALAVPVPLTGVINIEEIKAAFPSTNSNSLHAYFGKFWYKPSDGTTGTFTTTGPLRDSDFRGKVEMPTIHITSDTYNVNILNLVQNRITYSAGKTSAMVFVDSGVRVGSTSAGSPSMVINGFATGDFIGITNNGSIIGAGGNGGDGGGGNPGGTALQIRFPTPITNNGTIAGGGGGGGAGASGKTKGGVFGFDSHGYNGGQGGGGAGYNPGNNGATTTQGGGGLSNNGTTGGRGGNLGQTGTGSGQGGGGNPGYCIDGSVFIVGTVGGTKIGPIR
jgi:hypothetical protein